MLPSTFWDDDPENTGWLTLRFFITRTGPHQTLERVLVLVIEGVWYASLCSRGMVGILDIKSEPATFTEEGVFTETGTFMTWALSSPVCEVKSFVYSDEEEQMLRNWIMEKQK